MSNRKKMFALLDEFSEADHPAIFYAWQAVKLEPGQIPYREQLLRLLDCFNFENEYEVALRESIKACPNWEAGPKLLALWLKKHGQCREALYNARLAVASLPKGSEARAGLMDLLRSLKQEDGSGRREAVLPRVKSARRPIRKSARI